MKKTFTLIKKAFTIVELVIVIAVIAVLAAVLVPTFSNIINKANLSADTTAVREMNMSLAEWEASSGYARPADVDVVMQQLANAGYNTENWACLTEGYQVYWFKNDNRMILYNAKTATIEYPKEYAGTDTMVNAENGFFIYNYNHVKAQQFDMSISSNLGSNTVSGQTDLSSAVSVTKTDSGLQSNQSANISSISSAVTNNSAIKSALVSSANKNYDSTGSNLVYYATREVVSANSSNAYASLQVSAVGTSDVTLKSNADLVENLYYITIVANAGASDNQLKAAQKAAGEYVYNIFDQMTTGKVTTDATIILQAGTTLDCSTCEWAPCKSFSGYFGTTDASNPVIVNGARLTSATGHASTVAFNGSGSKYFVTGFFGTVYGNTTIENVKFTNISIVNPAIDYELTASDKGAKLINTRNSVGIIGGITDNYSESNAQGTVANVVLRNIEVDSSCSITGAGCVGGLVAYIGSQKAADLSLKGNVLIDNCKVHCDVTSTDSTSAAGYKAAGGLVGFCCRVTAETIITLKDCTFDGKLDGYGCLGAAFGAVQNGATVKFEGTMNLNNATLNTNGTAMAARSLIGYTDKVSATTSGNLNTVTSTATLNLISGLSYTGSADGTAAYDLVDNVWTKK